MKIALISCSKSKQSYECKASELYSKSPLFSASYKYAKILNVDKIYILSAKHGLIHEDEIIAPYELSLNSLSAKQRIDWANRVKEQIKGKFDPENDEIIVLTGVNYIKPLLNVQALSKYKFPLKGMRQGERVSFLNSEVARSKKSTY